MLSERILTSVMRVLSPAYLRTEPVDLRRLPAPQPGRRYTLYAHVPFCERLCPYCSFNRFLYAEDRARSYFRHLRTEMRMAADLGYDFCSLYIGGGTPTILVDELCATIDLARELFPGIREVSTETSPNHITDENIEALQSRVQRLSVGVQSFNDMLLHQMARYDKYGCGEVVFEHVSRAAGKFHSLNVDMIFNFPSQTREILKRDVQMVKATGANQTTFYPLMVSPKMRHELERTIGRVDLVRESEYYQIVCDGLAPEFQPSSAWTFSKDVNCMIDEYIVDTEEYLGIGSGAMSFLGGRVYHNTFSLRDYERRIREGRMSVAKAGPPFGRFARMRYRFMGELFGLSLDKKAFRRDFGVPVSLGLAGEVAFFRAAGAIAYEDEETMVLNAKGRYLLLVMMRESLAANNDIRDFERSLLPPDEKALLMDSVPTPCRAVSEDALLTA
ncbi:MAG: coproporphyrinogen III oxidase family protein [Anaerosomatales bacterium]|nr:coproporphyrinogen III oxidase family protein [Anaerosomatales bacterium]